MRKEELVQIIKELRIAANLTHQEMADKLGWGKQTYERLENGRTKKLDFEDINQIAATFGLSNVELINYRAPEGKVRQLLKEGITLFRQAQQKIDAAEALLNDTKKEKP